MSFKIHGIVLELKATKGVLGWRENGRGKKMGEENGVGGVFSLAWMGRKWERKEKGRGKVGGPHAPFSSQVFPPKMGGL